MKPIQTIRNKLKMRPHILAKELGVNYSTVIRWGYPREKGGTDGYIPRKYHAKLIKLAESNGIKLKPLDFIEQEDKNVPVTPVPDRDDKSSSSAVEGA